MNMFKHLLKTTKYYALDMNTCFSSLRSFFKKKKAPAQYGTEVQIK